MNLSEVRRGSIDFFSSVSCIYLLVTGINKKLLNFYLKCVTIYLLKKKI